MTRVDPFAVPDAGPHLHTWWSPSRMGSRFCVDDVEIEVQTHHWSGVEIYRIDGAEVLRVRNLGWHTRQALDIGGRSVQIVGRWYPLLPVRVTLDDRPLIDDLFPQLWWIKLALLALVCSGGLWWTAAMIRLWSMSGWG